MIYMINGVNTNFDFDKGVIDMQSKGKKFEKQFKDSIPEYCMEYKLPDPPQSFNQDNSNGIRFSWKNPCDFFVFDDKNVILYALELKSTKSKSISFEDWRIDKNIKQPKKMIHRHQIEALIEFDKKYENMICGFVFNFRDEQNNMERTYFQHINDFVEMCNKFTKLSFNEIDLIMAGHLTINGTKKRVNYTWNIDDMLTKLNANLRYKQEKIDEKIKNISNTKEME